MEKARLKDIAEKAGVSVATVSYVLSNKTTQKISEETRLKIIQIASVLNYKKNTFASTLANGKTNQIGLYFGNYNFPIAKSEIGSFVTRLVKSLKSKGFNTTIIPNGFTILINNVDAILCIGANDEEFVTLSKNNTIPVLAIDSIKHIPWTFQLCHTFSNIKEKFALNEFTLVTLRPNSIKLQNLIKENIHDVLFIDNYLQLNNLSSTLENKNVVVAGNDLFEYLQLKNLNLYKYDVYTDDMLNMINDCLDLAIEHNETDIHDFNY